MLDKMEFMGKKDVVITSRISSEMMEIIKSMADDDDRCMAYMVRKLLSEALEARGMVGKKDKEK